MTRRIGYVLLEFPRYSETFILNELAALCKFGIPSRIFCLRGGQTADRAIPEEYRDCTDILSDEIESHEDSFGDLLDLLEEGPRKVFAVMRSAYGGFVKRSKGEKPSQRERFLHLACVARLATSCRSLGIDHLHCHYATQPLEIGFPAAELAGISCSFTGHAKDIFTMPKVELGERVRRAAFAVACSRTGAAWMTDAAPDCAGKIHCVYHGIRLDDWRIERRPPAQPPLFLAIGRLTAKKGFPLLVDAVARLKERGINVDVDIIGEGREWEPIARGIEERGLVDRVRLRGRLGQEKIRERFAVATALVLPSVVLPSNNQDGIANVVIEAMAAGVPVIVSDIPALREIIEDGRTGLLFPAGDASALAEEISQLLSDPKLQSALSLAGRERVTGLDCRVAAQILARLFDSSD